MSVLVVGWTVSLTWSDPSYTAGQDVIIEINGDAHKILSYHCRICDQKVPDQVKHCAQCDRCVLGFDHHCIWLNNCIGKHNYDKFFQLICLFSLQGLL